MYDIEEQSDIIGKSCTLLNPYKGYTEGTIVGDYGNRIIVCSSSGKSLHWQHYRTVERTDSVKVSITAES